MTVLVVLLVIVLAAPMLWGVEALTTEIQNDIEKFLNRRK